MIFLKSMMLMTFDLYLFHCLFKLKLYFKIYGHIHNQGTQKDGLTEKKTTKDYFWIFITFIFHDYKGLVYEYN